MAEATRKTVERPRTVTDKVTVYHLTLDKDEVRVLFAVLRRVGGAPQKGRKHADSLLDALGRVGVAALYPVTVKGTVEVLGDAGFTDDSFLINRPFKLYE